MTECPHCGQAMLMKFGIRFTRQQVAIFDMIEQTTKGRDGITIEALSWVFFPGVPKRAAEQRIRTVVCQINDKLVSTDLRIVNEYGNYRVVDSGRRHAMKIKRESRCA